MGNIIFGIIFIIGGLSGSLALRGTNSSEALVVVGIALTVWGFLKKSKVPENTPAEVGNADGQGLAATQEKTIDETTCYHCKLAVAENPCPHCGQNIYGE